jgi:ABC-type branched-subunit amino acid transport system substrate-binding protein
VINLGAVITESGLGDETPVYRGLDAAIKEVDAAGGVDGSKLQLEVLDDGTDPNRGQAALRRLVESDHVFALAGECAPLTDINAGPYIEQQQIPTFGSCFASGAEYRNPFFFPIVVEPFLEGRLDASFLTTQMGVQHPALVSLDVNVLAETHDGVLSQLQDEHVAVCDAAKVPIEQALYDNVVLNEIQKGCDGVVLNLDPPRILDYLQAAQRYGYHPRMIGKTAFDQSVAQNGGSEAEGLVTYFAQLMPAVETQSAAVQHFTQVMHRYHPEEHDLNLALVGYLAGSGIAGELSRIVGPITRAALLQAIYSRPLDLGLAPPAHWTKTDHLAETSCRFYQLRQGEFQPASGWYHL